MKKLAVLIVVFGILLTGCNITKEVSSKAFPDVYTHIEFWNGGAKMFEADNVTVKFIKANVSGVLQSEYFLLYEVYSGNKLIQTIMDSDMMSITWK